ncbi:MAG: TAXI family TRAP transporter solute-binding subunit [Rhodoplanes sp.]
MPRRFIPATIAFAIIVLVGLATLFVWRTYPWVFSGRYTLQIAVGPTNERYAKLIAAFKRELAHEHPRVQLKVVETENLGASAAALQRGDVDAAIVRGDDPAAAEGRAIFILRKFYVAVLTPAHTVIENMADLTGDRIGVLVKGVGGIDPMAKAVLDFYRLDEKHVVPVKVEALASALRDKHIKALVVVGPIGPGPIADAVEVFRKSTKKPPKFIDLTEAAAIAERYPVYEKAEISDGSIDASPPIPADDVTTVSTSIFLVARESISNYVAGELTRLLLATRSKVASALPEAGQLVAPSTDRDAILPAHPGTSAFLNGDQPDLLDESLNYVYLGTILTGVLGSLAAWMTALRNRNKLRDLQAHIERLPVLLSDARGAAVDQLNATEEELERLSEWFLERFVADDISPEVYSNASTRIAHIRALIERRRACLGPVPENATTSSAANAAQI